MTYFLLLLILFNRPGDIREIVHLDTIRGKDACIERMSQMRDSKDFPREAWFSCVPIKVKKVKI